MHARRLVPVAYALVTFAAAVALAAPTPLRAQELDQPRPAQNPTGLYYSVRAGGTEMFIEHGEQYFGVGGGGQAGYNLNRMFGVFIGFDYSRPGVDAADFSSNGVTADENFLMTHVEIGGRVNVPLMGRRLLPYVDAAYARRAMSYSFLADAADGNEYFGRYKFVGNNMIVGGGVQLFMRPTIALDLSGRVSFGDLDHGQLNMRGGRYTGRNIGDDGVRFSRISAGATWYYPTFRFD
jgi:hypothetical protein